MNERALESSDVNSRHYIERVAYQDKLHKQHRDTTRSVLLDNKNIDYASHMPWLREGR